MPTDDKDKKFKVVAVPSFKREIDKIRDKSHLELIIKSIEKIERLGTNVMKFLHIRKNYILGEIKFLRPPYRLYVVFDQSSQEFYIVNWTHKKKQERVIDQLKKKLDHAFEIGIENIIELFK